MWARRFGAVNAAVVAAALVAGTARASADDGGVAIDLPADAGMGSAAPDQAAGPVDAGGPIAPSIAATPVPERDAGGPIADAGYADLSLEQLLEVRVDIAARTPQTPEQAPSIVTVITRSEIETYGARDAADILRMIPGFEFGMDVTGVAGLGFRGIWVQEGKALMMINGLPINDHAYGNQNLLGELPAETIERVEVIRGPGSALYGGFAEVAAVNFITAKGSQIEGVVARGRIGAIGQGEFARSGSVSGGLQVGDTEISAHVAYSASPFSQQVYNDYFGSKLQLNEANYGRSWQEAIIQASSHGVHVDYHRTSFNYNGQDGFFTIDPAVNGLTADLVNNTSDVLRVSYDRPIAEGLKLLPLGEFARGNSINTALRPASPIFGEYSGTGMDLLHYRAELGASYDIPGAGQLLAGVGYERYQDKDVGADNAPGFQLSTDPKNLSYDAHSDSKYAFAQYLQQLGVVGVTAGARYDNTTFGSAFAPRLGLTFVPGGAFNAKLLFGRAFRIPTPWQVYSRLLNFPGSLNPETADNYQAEVGYRFSSHLSGRLNGYFIDVRSPIVYQGALNSYQNYGRIQSYGAEAELEARFLDFGGFFNVGYSRPGTATSKEFLDADKAHGLGLPPIKANLGAYYRLSRFRIAPSLTFLGTRYAQSAAGATADPVTGNPYQTQSFDPVVLVNLTASAIDILPGLDVHLSGHNLVQSNYVLLQPYYGSHAPMPTNDREVSLAASYKF
jgi:outer membrane cobalamin receptor